MKIYKDFNLTQFNSYKINSVCEIAYIPENELELFELIYELKDYKFEILGNGNNTILSKNRYTQPFIILNGNFNNIEVDNTYIIAESGATALDVSNLALRHSLTGAEFLFDIPSSVGGAVIMNAGTMEGETKNILHKVRYLDLNDFLIKEKFKADMNLAYRESYFQNRKDCVILKAWFKLEIGDYDGIEKLMRESRDRRWSKQPRDYPNCGSVFKRPSGKYVGPMLDELGLKGFTIGGAQVSTKHSGFIVNISNATGSDILSVINHVQQKVRERFNISLEVEQRII